MTHREQCIDTSFTSSVHQSHELFSQMSCHIISYQLPSRLIRVVTAFLAPTTWEHHFIPQETTKNVVHHVWCCCNHRWRRVRCSRAPRISFRFQLKLTFVVVSLGAHANARCRRYPDGSRRVARKKFPDAIAGRRQRSCMW